VDYGKIMSNLLELAGMDSREVPVAAAIIDENGEVLVSAANRTISEQDPTAHAEVVVIRKAAEILNSWRLDKCTLVVTLEPCVMCAAAIKTARIPKVVFGAWDERAGGSGSRYDILRDSRLGPPIEVTPGVLAQRCSSIMTTYFSNKR